MVCLGFRILVQGLGFRNDPLQNISGPSGTIDSQICDFLVSQRYGRFHKPSTN